ncbi:hypothetical protein ACB098_07G149600 [Castanea mollissima]
MTQDVEMKELPAPSNSASSSPPSTLHHLKEIASLIETGAYAREVRQIMHVVRLTMALRRKLNATVLASFLNFVLTPGSELHGRLFSYLPKGYKLGCTTQRNGRQTRVQRGVRLVCAGM